MSNDVYGGWIAGIAARFQRHFDQIVTGNNLEYGPEFEIAVVNALREILPQRFGICRGYVVEQSGKRAGDDIIIYDRWRFPTIHALGGDPARKDHVPFEAVLAYIEAKHTLKLTDDEDRQSLRKAAKQIAGVRALYRESVKYQGGPITKVYCAPGFPSIENELYCGVFARHVDTGDEGREALPEALMRLHKDEVPLPDAVVAGPYVAIPARYELASNTVEGARPFMNVEGNLPIFLEHPHAFGLALVHLISTMESITLGVGSRPRP
jgi:hypothetical protein